MPKRFFLTRLAAAAIAFAAIPASAATFTVTQTGDSGEGSLRAAIISAQSSPDPKLIVFDLPGAGPHVIAVASSLPTISSRLTILNDRSGDERVSIQRDSANGFRIFRVQNPNSYVLIAGLTISNGNVAGYSGPGQEGEGGAILNNGTLTVRNCTFSGNAAVRGGAIRTGTWNALAVIGCTFVTNSAVHGGAIYHSGTLEVTNSTFSGNSATGNGGAISSSQNFAGEANGFVKNVTFSGNSASSGGALHCLSINAPNDSALSAANTIFQRGSSGANVSGPLTSNGYNLSDDASVGGSQGDMVNTNPQLSPLGDNGGVTPTHALLATSPAIDKSNDPYAPLTDQRNHSRVGLPDIGAFEYGGTPAPPPPAMLTVTNTNDSGPGSLRQTIFNAGPGTTVDFAPDVTGAIVLTSGPLEIDKDLTIVGPGASVLAVDGNGTNRVFEVGTVFFEPAVQIVGLTIRGGRVVGTPNSGEAVGGGILTTAILTLQDCIISGNSSVGSNATSSTASGGATGGGIAGTGGRLILIRTTVRDNSAVGGSGSPTASSGAYASGGRAAGGGISLEGNIELTDSRIEGNVALGGKGGDGAPSGGAIGGDGIGGGVHQYGFYGLTATNSLITGNTARAGHGGIGAPNGAGGTQDNGGYGGDAEGGGLYLWSGGLDLVDSTVSNNDAVAGNGGAGALQSGSGGWGGKGRGGGLFNAARYTWISGSTFNGNSTSGGTAGHSPTSEQGGIGDEGAGGGMFRTGDLLSSSMTLLNCTFSGNSANGGGAVLNTGNPGRGGGIAHFAGGFTSINTTLANNTATGDGGDGVSLVPPRGGCLFVQPEAPGLEYTVTAILRNTIVSGGSAGQGPDVYGLLRGSSFNLIRDGSHMTGVTNGNNGNQVGTNASPIDPELGPLADNGGPTLTHAFAVGSRAHEAGDNGAITNPPFSGPPFFDQRGSGFPRIVNSTVDIGSFESAAPTPTPSPASSPTPSPAPSPTPIPTPTPTPSATTGLVGNVATRLPVGTGDSALIQGFIVQGPVGSTKKIMVRALGPFLSQFGITDALPNPTLEIRDGNNIVVAANNDWKTTQTGGIITGDQSGEISSSGLAPGEDLESAIIANLLPGSYTAVVRGAGNTTGTGIVDAYDMSAGSSARLVNIATRGFIQPGDKLMIAGFIIQDASVRAAIRAIGPSLTQFGITNALPDTTLQLRDQNGAILLENDNWKTDPAQKQELESNGLQPGHDLEAALIMTIPPGQYTAQVRGKGQDSGIGVVEVYFLQ